MNLLLSKLASIGVGAIAKTEADFHAQCEADGVEIIWSDKKYSFYFTVLGEHFIVLPKRIKGLRLLFAMWHEYGHYAAHEGDDPISLFHGLEHTKDECEADAVALVAIIPKHLIKEMAFLDGSRYGGKIWNERLRLYFLYGI